MKKLTPSIKKHITAQWAKEFPSLYIYKTMRLLRQVGPLLQGICLERDSSNASYLPIFHVHNLASEDDFISLSLYSPLLNPRHLAPDRITIMQHDKNISEIIARFRNQIPFPLEGDLSCDVVVKSYLYYIKKSGAETHYPLSQYYDMICLLLWCDRVDEAREVYDRSNRLISNWPNEVKQNINTRLENFYALEKWLNDPSLLRNQVVKSIETLKLNNLPIANLC